MLIVISIIFFFNHYLEMIDWNRQVFDSFHSQDSYLFSLEDFFSFRCGWWWWRIVHFLLFFQELLLRLLLHLFSFSLPNEKFFYGWTPWHLVCVFLLLLLLVLFCVNFQITFIVISFDVLSWTWRFLLILSSFSILSLLLSPPGRLPINSCCWWRRSALASRRKWSVNAG